MRARDERLFSADVKSCSSLPTPAAGAVESKEGFYKCHQLLLARVVAVPTQGQVPLQAVNLSTCTVTLYKGPNIAQFHPLATSDGTDAETTEYCEMLLSAQGQARRVHQVGLPQSAATLLGIDTSNMDKAH